MWLRHSAEFRAASETLYRAAESAFRQGLGDPAWTAEPTQRGDLSALPPAVVMDIDETVLDNSAHQAQMTLDNTCFDEFAQAWDAWLAARSAPAIPAQRGSSVAPAYRRIWPADPCVSFSSRTGDVRRAAE